MSFAARRGRPPALLGIALVAVASVALASCSSTTKTAATGAPLPGITSSSVKVGFTIVDTGSLTKNLGFTSPNFGGVSGERAAINAIVAYINKNGGMGGRQVTADIKVYPAFTDSPQQAQAQCSAYTQDDAIFGVVMDGQLQTNAQPCYDAAHTIVVDETLVAHDQTQFEQNAPYLWSPSHPEYDAFITAQLKAMQAANFFASNTGVLIMPGDDDVSRRAATNIVKPFLTSIGISNTQTSYIDSTNTGTLGATSAAALTAGKNANLNRVIVVGGARIEPVALSSVNAAGYNSTWSISTYDDPYFTQTNPTSINTNLRNGMEGLGYAPSYDLVGNTGGPAFPDPNNPYQKLCYSIVTQAGATPPGNLRSNWTEALQYCDGAMFLKAVLDKLPGAGTVTGTQFEAAAGQIGGTFGSALSFGSTWGPGVFAGTDEGEALSWNSSTQAFTYSGNLINFGNGAGTGSTGTPASSTPVGTTPAGSTPASSTPAGTGSVPLQTITAPPQ